MITLSHGVEFDDEAAERAYARAQRQGLVKHYAPGLSAHATGRFSEPLAPKPAPGLLGLVFGRARK